MNVCAYSISHNSLLNEGAFCNTTYDYIHWSRGQIFIICLRSIYTNVDILSLMFIFNTMNQYLENHRSPYMLRLVLILLYWK